MTDLPPVTHVRTPRTARVAHLGPADAPAALWVALHGYRQLAPWFLRHLRVLDDGSRRILAPEALNRFYVGDPDGRHGPDSRVGATWMTREDREREIADYVEYLEAVASRAGPVGPARPLVVLGFSQGAHTAARWVCRSSLEVRAVVLWGEGLPHDIGREDLEASPRRWILVRGEADPSRDAAREARDEAHLSDAGIDAEVRTHPFGHRIDADTVLSIAEELDA